MKQSDYNIILSEKKSNNPPWSRDELIIILHLYYQIRGRRSTVDETTKEKYSKILIKLSEMNGIQVEKFSDFRSPSSVGLRISNFFNLDKHKEKGMSSHSKHARKIWEEFAYDYDGLKKKEKVLFHLLKNTKNLLFNDMRKSMCEKEAYV